MTVEFDLFFRFGAALAIGFMIGLQREFAHGAKGEHIIAGERTFALLSVSGCLAAMLSAQFDSPAIFVGVLAVFGILTAVGYFTDAWQRQLVGITTEVAIMISIMIGALCYWDHVIEAAAFGIATTVILSLKIETDRFVHSLNREEILAALQLAVITAIVLPILPNESIWAPPFDVLNPYKIWLMVVFISSINFLGYILIKVVGPNQGIGLAGFLGGLVSSTATTLSFSERGKKQPDLAKPFALAITVSWTVMFSRVLIEVGVLNMALLEKVWVPIASAGLVALLYCGYLLLSQRTSEKGDLEFTSPLDLASALKFGLLYGIILLISRTAHMYFHETGIFVSSILSGLADVDAITLSMSELSSAGTVGLDTASRAIVLAAMSNTVVKGGIVLMSGVPSLRKAIWPGVALILATGIGVAFIF